MTPEQIASVVDGIKERVRSRHDKRVEGAPDFELPSLDPLGHARDAALGKVASIGSVNPRPPGLVNAAIQKVKKTIARSLGWFVRDQVEFNRAAVEYMDRSIDVEVEQNYNLLRVAKSMAEFDAWRSELGEKLQLLDDALKHWASWRPTWEDKLTQVEIDFLHAVRDVEAAARDRESALQGDAQKMHADYLEALRRSTKQIQKKLWEDLAKLKAEQEHLIHTELRLIRQRSGKTLETRAVPPSAPVARPAMDHTAPQPAPSNAFDYARFEERFRGTEAYVSETQQFYLPRFETCRRVIDLGCGRGEFLEILRKAGISAIGVDLDADAVAACRDKGLEVEQADLFAFLAGQPDDSVDGILCAHVVEHLSARQTPELTVLAAQKLSPGGILAIETPNPGCLAIFARDFYLDPTHLRPVPANQLHFYLEEAGLVEVEIVERHPASEVYAEIAALDQIEPLREFRQKFFGGLDYTIFGRKWKP